MPPQHLVPELPPDLFRALVQALPDLVWIKDPDGVYLTCNPRFAALYGVPATAIVGKTDADFVDPALADFFRRHDLAAIEAGRSTVNEERLRFASDGHVEHLQTVKTPMFDAEGRLIGVLGIARDISEHVRLKDDLEQTLARLREAERIARLGAWEHDLLTNRLHWSPQVHRIFETDEQSHQPSLDDFWSRVHPEDLGRAQQAYAQSVAGGKSYQIEHRIVLADGRIKHVLEHVQPFLDPEGRPLRSIGTVQDISEQVRQQEALNERLGLFSAVVSQSADSIAIVDPMTGRFVEFNDSAARSLGYTRNEFAALSVMDVEINHSPNEILENLQRMTGSEPIRFESRHRHQNGQLRDVAVSGCGILVDGQRYVTAVWRDITEARRAEQEIHRLSYFDGLTQLPNRHLLTDRVEQLIRQVDPREPGALLIINLDRFHAINDALGRPVGDEVLREVARRLGQLQPAADSVMHLGADEFVILLAAQRGRHQGDTAAEALRVANAGLRELHRPFVVGEHTMELRVSVGVALLPQGPGDSFSDVMRRADTALHRAKRASVQRVAFFDESMGEAARHQFTIEQALREAIPGDQLRLFLQSQFDRRGEVVGAEALVRWSHPQRGMVSPAEFIPVAEESGLIVALDRWMLNQVAGLTRKLRDAGRPLRIAVNISPRHFHSPDFVSWVQACLLRHRALPDDLMLEVTEGLVIENIAEVIAKMQSLTEIGLSFSMDDFGTGYSSLSYLKRLPIHELKIDRSFIHDATDDADGVALISTILAVAKHMGLDVVAEGIETPQQASLLIDMAPQIRLQGYHFDRPRASPAWCEHWLGAPNEQGSQSVA